jgi:hypothetical protein
VEAEAIEGRKNLMMRKFILKPEGGRGTSSANKSIQNCLQDERKSLQGDHR